jgi:hypothetical protein
LFGGGVLFGGDVGTASPRRVSGCSKADKPKWTTTTKPFLPL